MKTERLILSFVAILLGLVVAGIAFYFYQTTRTPAKQSKQVIIANSSPTPTPKSNNFLTIDRPKDEEVINKRTVMVTGRTLPEATVIISSENTDQVVTPAANGTFTATHTIGNETTLIQITAIFPNGEEKKVTRTITSSAEEF